MSFQEKVHPAAFIEEGAKIGKNVTIEPGAVVKKNVELGDNVVIKSHAYIDGYTTIGEGSVIYPYASIGTKPQDLKYRGEKTYVRIGKNCDIREYVTINASCGEGSATVIGDNCLIMAYCHIAHNCELSNNIVMSNNAMLAGHVTVGDHAVIGGKAGLHQFCRVGRYAMIGGFSMIGKDVPPFTIGQGGPYKLGGLNLIGLKRHNFTLEERKQLTNAFKITYRSGLSLEDALNRISSEMELTENVKYWLDFFRNSKRGVEGFDRNLEEATEEGYDMSRELLEESLR